VCALGLSVGDDGGGPAGDEHRAGSGGPGGRTWSGAEAAGNGGAAVLEVVEAGGDAGPVEEPVGAEGPVGVGESEPVEVHAEHPVVDLARPLGHPCKLAAAEWRHLSAHPELVARQPVGHPEADEPFDGPPRAPAARERRAQAERLAKLTQVDHGRFALAPQHGQAP
jgi:hypothetical protein